MFKGVIFDMDDTLITSSLNLDIIRNKLKIESNSKIIEYVESISDRLERQKAMQIVEDHEVEAAETAQIQPGLVKVLKNLDQNKIKRSIFTRNCLKATMRVVDRLNMEFEPIVTRNCAPAKPDPSGLIQIVEEWGFDKDEVLYVGDYLFDIEAGKNAGVATALYTPNTRPHFAELADYEFSHYNQFMDIVFNNKRLMA